MGLSPAHIRTPILAAFLFVCLFVSAQDANDEEVNSLQDTVSVRIQGDSIIYRYRPRSLSKEMSSAPQIRTVPDSIVAKMKGDKVFEYANDPSFWKKEPPADDSGIARYLDRLSKSSLVKWLLYMFLAAIILFVIYQVMVVNDFFIFYRRKKTRPPGELESENIESTNLDALLEQATRDKNYRLAVRYLYLKTLRLLSERGLLRLDSKATNHDYALQLKNKELRSEFMRLVKIYEYAWYGEYSLSDQQFHLASQNFTRFIERQ